METNGHHGINNRRYEFFDDKRRPGELPDNAQVVEPELEAQESVVLQAQETAQSEPETGVEPVEVPMINEPDGADEEEPPE